MDRLTQYDRDKLADIVWWIRGQVEAHKLNDDFSLPFDDTHIKALQKAMNQETGILPHLQTLPNHWITEPIHDLRQLRFEAEAKRSVWHKYWGIRPAAFIINMNGHVISTIFQGDNLYKLIKK